MKLLTLLLSLTASTAFAGTSDRGGGNALVCFDSPSVPKAIRTKGNPAYGEITEAALKRINKIEMLDLYQAKLSMRLSGSERKRNIMKARPGDKPDDLADRVLRRIENYAPGVYKKIFEGYWALRLNTSYAPHGVATIDDTELKFQFDRNLCVIVTIAAQDAENNELFVDSRLFSHPKHSLESRATMLVHEWIYHSLLRAKVDNSAGVRSIVTKLILDEPTRVADLIEAAANAKLISTESEKLSGLQLQIADKFAKIADQFRRTADHNWYTGDCPERLCSTFWMFRKEYEDEMNGLPGGQCFTLDNCVKVLERIVSETQDPELKKRAERLLSMTNTYLDKLMIGDDLKQWLLPIKLDPRSGEYPLPDAHLKEAAENLTWTVNQAASAVDSFAVSWAPMRRFDDFGHYQKAMREVRDISIERTLRFRPGSLNRFDFLTLPYFE